MLQIDQKGTILPHINELRSMRPDSPVLDINKPFRSHCDFDMIAWIAG